jgi:hypothetical protein
MKPSCRTINLKGNTTAYPTGWLYPESAVKSSNEWAEIFNHDMEDKTL